MLPFTVQFRPDQPPYEQVVFAVKKAVFTGVLRPGDKFPSVRTLSQELRINPNTAHKVVAQLTAEGLLQVHPGIGTIVQKPSPSAAAERRRWLETELERLVVEARHLGIGDDQLRAALERQLTSTPPPSSTP
ncbi:GntR family transcriptional regulator [Actomonas aquatica]|uniref:GntR family transcriptional regulator n=1 Tax=Actomonas aquatica TaxID=2866162 RepID=A0ABZ1C8Y6_9BACT|nr:GntR family transcriptional regulator [Opitutus sp. WL0086]WRQ87039.1 GntR family transcriptional regulator [Opitutus sp. WL0086]